MKNWNSGILISAIVLVGAVLANMAEKPMIIMLCTILVCTVVEFLVWRLRRAEADSATEGLRQEAADATKPKV